MVTFLAPVALVALTASVGDEVLTLPPEQRPQWLRRDGIVMAGSWEPLLFRVRRDGAAGYTPTPEQRANYEREHSPEMIAELKALGVNFIMMHSYKAFGRQAERESMADAVRFARLCREAGLRVGVYNNSGTIGWELLYRERPEAKDWTVLDAAGKPVTYGGATYRYYWNRNHPDAQAFHYDLVRFSIHEIKADLLHFDNYHVGPGSEPLSAERFRKYLGETFSPEQRRRLGFADLQSVKPPLTGPPDNVLRRAWLDFCCRSLAESYHDIGRFARTLRKDILLECNPGGPGERIRPPVDHGRLLTGGEAFWDEGEPPGWRDGRLRTRIRTYKVARRALNMAFAYTTTPLEAAESMAFNLDCLGCICWFEYGRLVLRPGEKEPVSPDLAPFVRFFHRRRDLFRDAAVLADAAVLRSFPSQVFAEAPHAQLTARAEQALIENRVPFQILYDGQLTEWIRANAVSRTLVLAGCVAMSDAQIDQVRRYAAAGGGLCIVGPAATHDEWMEPRARPELTDVAGPNIIRVAEGDDVSAAVVKACGGRLSGSVNAPVGLCAEYTEQPGRRLVHLVNYRPEAPMRNVAVSIRLPQGGRVKGVSLASPVRDEDATADFTASDGQVRFTVPTVDVYVVAVVTIE